jgi:hypothetical protein
MGSSSAGEEKFEKDHIFNRRITKYPNTEIQGRWQGQGIDSVAETG